MREKNMNILSTYTWEYHLIHVHKRISVGLYAPISITLSLLLSLSLFIFVSVCMSLSLISSLFFTTHTHIHIHTHAHTHIYNYVVYYIRREELFNHADRTFVDLNFISLDIKLTALVDCQFFANGII